MNKVELLVEQPLVFGIVDLEPAIGRDALSCQNMCNWDSGLEGGLLVWLNCTKIGSKHLS